MPALLSPLPLLPPFDLPEPSPIPIPILSPPPIYCANNKEPPVSYNRLRSPSLPPEPFSRPPSAMMSKQPSCTSTPRRRSKAPSHSLRRRRLASRVDYSREHSPLHAFDKLPWIASLDVPPGHDHPWDIADLSLIPDPEPSHIRPSGPGPVRRRKGSPRSSPMVSSLDLGVRPEDYSSYNLFPRDTPSRPSTPASRFDPTRVTFRHLMPVTDDEV